MSETSVSMRIADLLSILPFLLRPWAGISGLPSALLFFFGLFRTKNCLSEGGTRCLMAIPKVPAVGELELTFLKLIRVQRIYRSLALNL